jgi:hypothetical protein
MFSLSSAALGQSDSPRQSTTQITSGTAAELAVDTQVGSNPKKDATIKQSSTSVIAAVSQARRINCRPILGSYVGSGLLIDKYYPFFWHFNKRCNQSGFATTPR